MIVVSNTSPLTNLAAIGQFDLLHKEKSPTDLLGFLRLIKIFKLMLNYVGNRTAGSKGRCPTLRRFPIVGGFLNLTKAS